MQEASSEISALRARVREGSLRRAALRAMIASVAEGQRDAWLDALLGIGDVPADEPLPLGAVPYLPCAVDDALAMLELAEVTERDRVVDVGAGLGRLAVLAHLVTGAATHGLEIQRGLVERATAIARMLALDDVRFSHADASASALEGDVFLLYAPCSGALLDRVVSRLEHAATERPLRVATLDMVIARWPSIRSARGGRVRLYGPA